MVFSFLHFKREEITDEKISNWKALIAGQEGKWPNASSVFITYGFQSDIITHPLKMNNLSPSKGDLICHQFQREELFNKHLAASTPRSGRYYSHVSALVQNRHTRSCFAAVMKCPVLQNTNSYNSIRGLPFIRVVQRKCDGAPPLLAITERREVGALVPP